MNKRQADYVCKILSQYILRSYDDTKEGNSFEANHNIAILEAIDAIKQAALEDDDLK